MLLFIVEYLLSNNEKHEIVLIIKKMLVENIVNIIILKFLMFLKKNLLEKVVIGQNLTML
jgi:hypothetical protein